MYLSIIGQRIRKHRMNKGLTQEELGDLLGVQKSAVQKYENGSISLKGETVKKLCEIFSVLPYELIWENHVDRAEAIVDILKRNEELKQKVITMELGRRSSVLISMFNELNIEAKSKVIEYATDLAKIPEYAVQDGSRWVQDEQAILNHEKRDN